MPENADPIYGVVTLMMSKHLTQLLSTTKGGLRPRLANLQSKYAKLIYFSSSDFLGIFTSTNNASDYTSLGHR